MSGGVAGEVAEELFVNLDRARVVSEAKIDDREEILTLRVAGLELERLLELFFRLVDAVVLQQLAAAIEVKEKVFGGSGADTRCRWSAVLPLSPEPPCMASESSTYQASGAPKRPRRAMPRP